MYLLHPSTAFPHLDRITEVQLTIDQIIKLTPDLTATVVPFHANQHKAWLISYTNLLTNSKSIPLIACESAIGIEDIPEEIQIIFAQLMAHRALQDF